MRVTDFIQQSFRERAEKAGALIVHDPERRLREIVVGMAHDGCQVIDASDSFIEAQEKAIEWWARAGDPKNGGRSLIVYLPQAAPTTSEDLCQEPFSAIAAGADRFPVGDGDTFQLLCERAKPEHKEKIRNLFARGIPDLATMEAVGGGSNWPHLRTLFGVESVTDMLVALLVPNAEQDAKMRGGDAWLTEAKDMLTAELGFQTKSKSKKWEPLVDEVWRFLLFTEFAYDLPQELPSALAGVPVARAGAEVLVTRVCETLRQEKWHSIYITKANEVATELQLEPLMRAVEDLGVLDTFAFEERSFLRQYVKLVLAGELGEAVAVAERRRGSVWVRHTDRGMLWTIAESARELLLVVEDLERDLPAWDKSTNQLIEVYTGRAYRADQVHRELEKAVADALWEVDGVEELVETARGRHHAVSEKLQKYFVEAVAKEGWPVAGRLRATEVFDAAIAPLLEVRGKRVAFFMVDALRYELAVALEAQLAQTHTCRLRAACAQLPTITSVGMAALLPKAAGSLFLKRQGDELVPTIAGKPIRNPTDRRDYVQGIYGDRMRMIDLDAVVTLTIGSKKKPSLVDGVELLLVKTTDIDEQGELGAGGMSALLPNILARLVAAVGKLKRLGFHHVVFCTDHGFVLHSDVSPGNTLTKPSGDWLQVKDRCFLGSGSGTSDTLIMPKEHAGIAGDFTSYVVPRSFGTFNKRHAYFHEGLSLPEAVIPVLEVDFSADGERERTAVDVQLRYRGESTGVVTTKRPMIEVAVFGGDFFGDEVVFRLEARATKGAEECTVGEAASCQNVDAATGFVKLKSGQAVKIPLRIDDDFTGPFEVCAIDAETGVSYSLPLKLRAATIA